MTLSNLIDEVIEWNQKKASKADDPKDKARYEDNIRRLLEMKSEHKRPS